MKKGVRKLKQRVHRTYLIREAQNFKEHKKGIPEWLKNSDDSYIRHEEEYGIDFSNIPIIVNLNKTGVFCIDFGGSPGKDIIEHVPYYGSPDAASHGRNKLKDNVSGGHGNGGKYYALSQFEQCYVISYYNGKFTSLILKKDGEYVEYEDEEMIPSIAMGKIKFDRWKYFENERPDLIYKIRNRELNFFCWCGNIPKDKKTITTKKYLPKLIRSISYNLQSRSVLRSRIVDILLNGQLYWPALKPQQIVVDESFGTKEFVLPKKVGGYYFNKNGKSVLRITMSKDVLTGDSAPLNILEIDANNRNIAYYYIPNLMLDKGNSRFIVANIDTPELKGYNCVSNDRVNLIKNDISDQFINWCKARIQEVLDEIVAREKSEEEENELREISNFFEDILNEVKDLLEEEDILKNMYDKNGEKLNSILTPTEKPGFGGEGEVKKSGDGLRGGGLEIKDSPSSEKKSKSVIKILISGIDKDPLNPNNSFFMIERQPILYQRPVDVKYGIWWINSRKKYLKKIKIRDPGAIPFYFFLVKEVIFSHKLRKRYKDQERYDPDGLEELNFDLIDALFNKVADRLGIELSFDIRSKVEKIRCSIKSKDNFTVPELSKELGIPQTEINSFIYSNRSYFEREFQVKKIGKHKMKIYDRKKKHKNAA